MEQNEFYEVNGFIIKIPRDKYEFDSSYSDRVLFIISKLKNYDNYEEIKENLDKTIILSKLYINEKLLNCKY